MNLEEKHSKNKKTFIYIYLKDLYLDISREDLSFTSIQNLYDRQADFSILVVVVVVFSLDSCSAIWEASLIISCKLSKKANHYCIWEVVLGGETMTFLSYSMSSGKEKQAHIHAHRLQTRTNTYALPSHCLQLVGEMDTCVNSQTKKPVFFLFAAVYYICILLFIKKCLSILISHWLEWTWSDGG